MSYEHKPGDRVSNQDPSHPLEGTVLAASQLDGWYEVDWEKGPICDEHWADITPIGMAWPAWLAILTENGIVLP